MRLARFAAPALAASVGFAGTLAAQQPRVTAPVDFFGHEIGADYVLPNYRQLSAYFEKLAGESDRMTLVSIGQTTEGRPQHMAIVTSPANHRDLERYRDIARRLALADGIDEGQARALAAEGRAVVWIDGGLHATEVLGAQQLIETVYQLVSRSDAETLRILDDVIVLAVHANPDGHDLVADWYMREPDPLRRSSDDIPRLYQYYVGHDNNRDFYLSSQNETTNMNRVLYREWFPQILYNHHQTGPAGAVMFAPPFRDPFNHLFHPLIISGLDLVGAAMHNRFAEEHKPGVTTREGAGYSTWWNGGLRTTAYFHNVLGLLTETKGNPTPVDIPLIPYLQLPTGPMPFPIPPHEKWYFRQSIDYSVTANYAVLDIASRFRETFLYNIYRMAADEIAKGSTDTWTPYPKRIAALAAEMEKAQPPGTVFPGTCARVREGMPLERQRPCMNGEQATRFFRMLRKPEWRDPRGYVIPSDQPDFATATRFVHALQKTGVQVERATSGFDAGGERHPAGSYVIRTAQPYRTHVLDMFEPQDHPNDFEYPGGPPIHPYDAAGWTLAYQMGIRFERILDAFDGWFEPLEDLAVIPAGGVDEGRAAGYIVRPDVNDAFRVASRVLAARGEVYRLNRDWANGSTTMAAGSFYIPARGSLRPELDRLANDYGLRFRAVASSPPRDALFRVRQPRIGLVDVWGGSMPSGWTRWILEQFEIPFQVVFPKQLDAGNLNRDFDVLVFVDDVVPVPEPRAGGQPDSMRVPVEWRKALGQVTVSRTVPQLRTFLERGGAVIAIGGSTALATHLGLPVQDQLVERAADGTARPLTGEKYFIPTSVLRVRVDNTNPLAWGMGEHADVVFDESPVFRFGEGATGLERIAWYDSREPLRSGWAWGQHYLENGLAAARATVGRGVLYLFGPEILYRGQPAGTFRLFFNALYNGAADPRGRM